MQITRLGGAPELNVDMGVLVGILLTDGSISRKGKTLAIELTGKSGELHSLFKCKIKALFGITKFTEIADSRYPEIKRTIITNKQIAESLLNIVPTYRTKQFPDGSFPSSQLPKFIFKLNLKDRAAVLQTMFSCDGCISLWVVRNKRWNVWEIKRWVKFACKHPQIRRQVYELLVGFGYSPIIREVNDEILLTKKKDIVKFAQEIRFLNGVKVTKDSKNWEGFDKNSVLDFAVKSYNIKQDTIRNFDRKGLTNFIKSALNSGSHPIVS